VDKYDECDHTGDLAYITTDTIAMALGWNGLYIITESGTKVEKTDVFYCKTIGYGAPEKAGDPNALYMYGKPDASDPEGIYRSTDGGKTWVCINTEHIYGGTGNGNFIVGDMNEFGKLYMSTVGCGIVYGELSGSSDNPKPTESNPTESDETQDDSKNPSGVLWGDANDDGNVDISDVVLMNRVYVGIDEITDKGLTNADVDQSGKIELADSMNVLRLLVHLLEQSDFPISE
ncbi:MAG: dockerin type I repeat-containing protein, partial [Oscillospiraceae bacterium]|nr:dockerin type I repeat-containing protein [Oscillospiraceae bacterium]